VKETFNHDVPHAFDLSFLFFFSFFFLSLGSFFIFCLQMNSTYNLAFPALLYPGLNNKKAKDNSQWSLTPPKYPDYLKLTLYGKLAVEQHNLHQHREAIKTTLDEDFDELDLRLPTFWNSKDKSKNVEIGSNGLDLKYIGKIRERV
jgi:hypothetical protein